MLDQHGMSDVIDGMKDLSEMGRLEFVGSAKYHPILPLIPRQEMLRQIMLNHQTNKRFFGRTYSPQGFFSPELCYSQDILEPILETGHRWLIVSGLACPAEWPTDFIYQVKAGSNSMAVFFRDDILSNRISFKQVDAPGFIDQLRSLGQKGGDVYVVTAMDAETFGHHIRHWEDLFLAEVYEALQPLGNNNAAKANDRPPTGAISPGREQARILSPTEMRVAGEIKVVTMSQLLESFPTRKSVEPRRSSWSTSLSDIEQGNPYPLWKSKNNPVHQLQWQHLKISIELTGEATKVACGERTKYYADIARGLLDRAMHSDQFWWASQRPMWDINMVNRGLMEQREVVLNAYKAIKVSDLNEEEKTEAYYKVIVSRDLRNKIMDELFMH